MLDAHRLEHGTGVRKWEDAVGPGKSLAAMPVCLLGGTYNASYVEGQGYHVTCTIPSHDPAARGAAAPVEAK